MKKTLQKVLALVLSVAVFSTTIDMNAFAMEKQTNIDEVYDSEESYAEESVEEISEVMSENTEESETEDSEVTKATEEYSNVFELESITESITESISETFSDEDGTNESIEEVLSEETTENLTEIETTVEVEETSTEESTTGADSEKESIFEGENFKIIFSITSQWDTGYNASVKIENIGAMVIHDWYLEYDTIYDITSIWNASIHSNEGEKCIIKNAGWNQDIESGKWVEFGFSANGKFSGFPTKYKMAGERTQTKQEDYSVEYYVDNDWGSGFAARIEITNNTDITLEDWVLEFDFERNITNIWNGIVDKHEDKHYVIRNAGHNANIAAGQTVSFGFNGEDGTKENKPSNYKLYTYKISDKEYIELLDGNIDKDYMLQAIYPHILMKGMSVENIKLADDFDGDGLSLIEEYEYDTNPFLIDTDEDGLDDYEEINTYATNPIWWDTDGDEMSDGTEVSSGLDPFFTDSDGDGIPDGQEIVRQQVRLDRVCTYSLNENGTIPNVEIAGKGDYSKKMYAVPVENNRAVLDIDALVGTPFEFVHDDTMSFSESRLSFSISNDILKKYKIEDLAVAWYNYDENSLELLETEYDKTNNTISADVSHYSTYMVVSVPDYFFNIDWKNEGNIVESGKADVVVVVDTTGSMRNEIQNVRNNIQKFVSELEENKVDIRLGLVEYKDIYKDGIGSTKSHDWYMDIPSFKNRLDTISVSGGGGDGPETVVDALSCAREMKYRTGVKKYIIVLTDASYKNGTSVDEGATLTEEINKLVDEEITVSVVTNTYYFSAYSQLISATNGISANINSNFASAITPLITKMDEQVNDGCWIRLSNGSVVRLDKDPNLEDSDVDTDGDGIPDSEELKDSYKVKAYNPFTKEMQIIDTWSFYSDPSKRDTDGDDIDDAEDINPEQYDTIPVEMNESKIAFNTGRTWYINGYTAEEIWDAHERLEQCEYDLSLSPGDANYVLEQAAQVVNSNDLQHFTEEELTFISLMDADGIRFYLDSKPISQREKLFKIVYGRETDYYQKQGIINITWEKVSGYEANGFFRGRVLSEADIVYSFDELRGHDIYDVIELAKVLGIIVVSSLVVVGVSTVVGINIYALSSYISSYGIKMGIDFYLTLGVANAPAIQKSLMSVLATELTDGDTDEYRLIDYVDDVVYTADDGWSMAPVKRGNYFDDTFGNNLGHNFPVIDKLENRVITSIKSIDTGLKSYQGAKVYSKIVGDARKLYKFTSKTWANIPVLQTDYDSKVLQIILPNGTVTAEQILSLQSAKQYIMNNYNIQVIFTIATKQGS